VLPLASQPAGPNDGGGEKEGTPPQQDPASANPPATQPHLVPASPALVRGDTIVGVWAPDSGACLARDFRDGVLLTVINTDWAAAGDTFCMFTKEEQTEKGWRVVAKCSNPRERWTSNVRLTVSENRLTWASKTRHPSLYSMCARRSDCPGQVASRSAPRSLTCPAQWSEDDLRHRIRPACARGRTALQRYFSDHLRRGWTIRRGK
jgi:hypothetical protein